MTVTEHRRNTTDTTTPAAVSRVDELRAAAHHDAATVRAGVIDRPLDRALPGDHTVHAAPADVAAVTAILGVDPRVTPGTEDVRWVNPPLLRARLRRWAIRTADRIDQNGWVQGPVGDESGMNR